MANTTLRREQRGFFALRPSYFLIIAVMSLTIGVLALRSNNQHMVELRDAVYAADEKNDHVAEALQKLQTYVVRHMNTELSSTTGVYPPIQLKYTYDRLVQAKSDTVAQANQSFYTAAQKYCEAQNPSGFYGATRIGCVQDYLTSHGLQQDSTQIPDALYKFDFVSPRWSPDLAGWSLVVAAVSGILFVTTGTFSFVRRRASRR